MKFVFVLILTLLPLLGLSQEGEMAVGTDTAHDDEKALEDLQRAQQERSRKLGKVGDITNKALDPVEQMKKLDYQRFNPSQIFSKEALDNAEKLIREAELSKVPPEVMREKILESLKGNAFENFLRSSPKLLDFMVDFMRDEKAVLNAIQIFKNKSRLKLYLYCWIGIMFLTYYARKLFISKHWSRGVRSFASLMFSLTVTTITMSTFCLIFEAEMRPIISLVKKHL
jgi:hypothetical protein